MRITSRIIIDTRKSSKQRNGSFPVVVRLYKDGRQTYIHTGVYTTIDGILDTDDTGQVYLKKTKYITNIRRANGVVNNTLLQLRETIEEVISDGEVNHYTVTDIKKRFEGHTGTLLLTDYMQQLADNYKKQKRNGTSRWYSEALTFLKNNYKNQVAFSELTVRQLNNLETKYISEGKSYNGLSVYLRAIRAAYNKAIKEGMIDERVYPFKRYSIRHASTQKKALTAEQLIAFRDHLPNSQFRQLAKDLFFFSFNTAGMALVDIAHLKVKMIDGNRIISRREKVDVNFNLRINDSARSIIDRYIEEKDPDDYIFPIFKLNKSDEWNYYQLRKRSRNINRALQDMFKLLKITKHVTFYSARHTYATIAKKKGIDLATISELLRHSSIKTTQIYLDSLSSDVLDKANDDITKI